MYIYFEFIISRDYSWSNTLGHTSIYVKNEMNISISTNLYSHDVVWKVQKDIKQADGKWFHPGRKLQLFSSDASMCHLEEERLHRHEVFSKHTPGIIRISFKDAEKPLAKPSKHKT